MNIAILDETLSYLRFTCIWPKKGHDLNPGRWYYIKFLLMMIVNSVVLVGSILHLIVSSKNNATQNMSEDLVMIIAEVGVYYFLCIFVWYQEEIAAIYVDLSDFSKFGRPPAFQKRNNELIFLSKMYKNFIDVALFVFCVWSFVNKKICETVNKESEWKDVCGLIVPSWMPFNIEDFPQKQIFCLWQVCSLIFLLKGAAAISFAIMETMDHLVVRIQHLKVLLNDAIGTVLKEERDKLFSLCVRYHMDIFNVGSRIDKYYTGCLFLHVLLSGALFGCIGYKIREGFALNVVALLLGWFLSLYIVCISGQHLIDEATSVADLVYYSPWYDREADFQKNIIFIIQRSQRAIVVHAGPFSYVSHVIILTILKTAYSYMTLLNATTS